MTLGQKLKHLRTKAGLTQKELAEKLAVTFQTVSKWENDDNEPDINTIKELAKLYGCSVDQLISEEPEEEEEATEEAAEEKQEEAEPVASPVPAPAPLKPIQICQRCKKEIYEGDLDIDKVEHREHHGRTSTITYTDEYYHKDCLDKTKREREAKAAAEAKKVTSSAMKKSFGWGIAMGIVGLGIALALCLTVFKEQLNPGLAVLISVLFGYGVFADLYCIISGSYIGDVFTEVASWSIKFPGVIFTLDWDGIIFLIAVKILFAVLGFFISVGVLILAVMLSMALAMVSFPFVLIHNNRTDYEDAL